MNRLFIFLLIFMSQALVMTAQSDRKAPQKEANLITLHGRVFEAATGEPAPGIRVQAYNNGRYAAMTDEQGEYSIQVPKYVTSLTYEGEGYNLVQQAIGTDTLIVDVRMYSSHFFETYTKQTNAISSKTALADYNNNDVSIDPQVQQQFGGDMLTAFRSGTPGIGIRMLMNGINSLNGNAQPLVVIDGVPQNMQYDGTTLHDGFSGNLLANIMVEDIERISVLKNGAAIYGAKGANGVLLIETKRNKSMATRIDVSVGGSYQLLPRSPRMLDAAQYRIFASELIGTTGTKSNDFKFLQTDPNYYYYSIYHNNTDWSEEVRKASFVQNYSINVQGGDDVANYTLSVGYARANSTLKNNNYARFNLRLNSDINVVKNVSVRFDAAYSDVNRNMRDDGVKDNVTDGINSSPSFLSLIKAPFLSPYAFDTNGNISSYLAEADDYLSDVVTTQKYTKSLPNPRSILDNGEGDNKNYFSNRMISLAITPKWEIAKDWTLADHFAFQLVNTDENYYLPTSGVPSYEVKGIGAVSNTSSALAARQISVMNDLSLRWGHRWEGHLLGVQGGWRYLRDTYRLNTQVGYNTGNDKTPNMSSSLLYKQTDGLDNRDVNLTYYLTADYNYLERYYLTAAVSMDGSSKFGVDASDGVKIGNYAFGFFPSVEAAWVMSNERWFPTGKGLNYLKLNAGFDLLGNDAVNSQASRTYFTAKRIFDTTTGLAIANIGNTTLQWETTARFTAGIHLSAVNNRINFRLNYFNANTYNLLSLSSLSYLTGLQSNWTNNGRVRNEGFDVAVDAKVLSLKNWTWSVGASMGHYKSTVKALPGTDGYVDQSLYGATIRNWEGHDVGLFYGYRTNGVFATQAEADQAALYNRTETGARQYFQAGDMRFVDVNGDHCIDEQDMQVIGNPNPDLYGTLHTQLTWKNFALSANFVYSLGGDVYNYQRAILESGSYFYNQTTAMLGRWTYEGQHTDIPRSSFLDPMGNSRFSDRWIEDGSYLKLKTLTLSYTLPIRSTYLQGITIWAAANNLFTLTKYLGSDPEFSYSNAVLGMGIDRGLLGNGRSFSIGAKIKL